MQSERSMGIFILVCALICLTIAVDKYYSAIATAKLAAEKMPGFQLESVAIPPVTMTCGAVGMMLMVTSVILIAKSFRPAETQMLEHSDNRT